MAKVKPRVSTRQRVVGDFQFSDNQLQRVLGEMRQAVQHLQGYIGATEQLLTIEELQILIQELINNSPGGGTGGYGGIPEAPNDGEKYARQSENWTALTGGDLSGDGLKWIDYTTGFKPAILPTLIETIPEGDVYEYTYSNGTLYRLVATDGRDLFYSSFSSPTLSGLVSEKETTI